MLFIFGTEQWRLSLYITVCHGVYAVMEVDTTTTTVLGRRRKGVYRSQS